MALIYCPECRLPISDKSISCVHCGYPLQEEMRKAALQTEIEKQKENEEKERYRQERIKWQKDLEYERRQEQQKRLYNAKFKMREPEALAEFLNLGREGCWEAYRSAYNIFMRQQKWSYALDCLRKINEAVPNNSKYFYEMVDLLLKPDKTCFNPYEAVKLLKNRNDSYAAYLLGEIHNPILRKKGLEKYWNIEDSISYYLLSLSRKNYPSDTVSKLVQIFSAHKRPGQLAIATAYTYLSVVDGGESNGFNILKELLISQNGQQKGKIWIDLIEKMKPSCENDMSDFIRQGFARIKAANL